MERKERNGKEGDRERKASLEKVLLIPEQSLRESADIFQANEMERAL